MYWSLLVVVVVVVAVVVAVVVVVVGVVVLIDTVVADAVAGSWLSCWEQKTILIPGIPTYYNNLKKCFPNRTFPNHTDVGVIVIVIIT